ncbi:MAG: lysozyme inhibitor LprI family protein [Terracidiphilus sp.]
MKSMSPSLLAGAALLACWSALALAQSAPNPEDPPKSDASPAASNAAPTQPQTPAPEPPPPVADADLPPPGPPPPANFQHPIPAAQLAFLKDYDGKMPDELRKDKRFRELQKQVTPSTRYFYHYDISLSDARDQVLDNEPMPISVRDGRFVMVGTAGGPSQHMNGRGFLWFDIQAGIGLGGIYFHPTNGEPTPTLAIFSRQLTDTSLIMGQLPPDFFADFTQWAPLAQVHPISPRYFIPANGRKYVLVHDEDYCWHPPGTPAPDQDVCMQRNSDAADADMDAAYFMQETHNASDATAYMLGQDQIAWVGLRERTCGNGLACRVTFTRQRTRILIGRPSPAPPGRGR